MIDWSSIIPIIAVIIQGSIAILIAYLGWKKTLQGQERIQKDLEELRHRLMREKFFTEKWWGEAKSLYSDMSRKSKNFNSSMIWITAVLSGGSWYRLTLLYIYDKIRTSQSTIDWESILQGSTVDEKNEINLIDKKWHPERLRPSKQELDDVMEDVAVFASPTITQIWSDLINLSNSFLAQSLLKAMLLVTETSKRSNSPAEATALDILYDSELVSSVEFGKSSES